MAFTSAIQYKTLDPPYEKGHTYSGKVYHTGGTFTNTAGSTGGVIDLTGNYANPTIIEAGAIDETGANAIRIQINTPDPGKITITTTADDDGRWYAKVQNI